MTIENIGSLVDEIDKSIITSRSEPIVVPITVKVTPTIKAKTKPKIEKVVFNAPATIVMWDDHTKTVVKCTECGADTPRKQCQSVCAGEKIWRENGVLNAIAKKLYGSEYVEELRGWCQ